VNIMLIAVPTVTSPPATVTITVAIFLVRLKSLNQPLMPDFGCASAPLLELTKGPLKSLLMVAGIHISRSR
jgi:hypothetical protein